MNFCPQKQKNSWTKSVKSCKTYSMKTIEEYNAEILSLMSYYLNNMEKTITKEQIAAVTNCGVSELQAYKLLLLNILGIEDKQFTDMYFHDMIHHLDKEDFVTNAYYRNISFTNKKLGKWELKYDSYTPYELFVQDDFILNGDKVIPNLGFFSHTFQYPAIYQDGRLWMSVTPNEINTMIEPIAAASGDVVTFGLGLGYYPYMCSEKDDVDSVTIVEKDKTVIEIFQKHILPQFKNKDKIIIVNADAFQFLDTMPDGKYNYVFVDIYHDAGDGMQIYEEMSKKLDSMEKTKHSFWIEKTIRYYLAK